ncbi:MAG: DUF1501 domain-containing protein [Abitibacteriaceae bacterium]|nr:DUF1501 domain-containing protein [Abditibacteriaceae bacterium]
MATTRREFIQNGLSFVSLGVAMPTFLMRTAEAVAADANSGTNGGKILVVIEMSGGNDGLNTVIPFTDAEYTKLRPNIGIAAKDLVKIDAKLGLNPGMKSLGQLYEQGHVAVVNGVGYPNPNRSHFQSMDIWQTGDPNITARERTGWIARYFDADGHYKGNPLSGVTLGSTLPLAMWSQTSPVSVIGNGQDFGFGTNGAGANKFKQMETMRALYAEGTVASSHAEFIRNVGQEVYSSTAEIKTALKGSDNKATIEAKYPNNNPLAPRLQTIAKLIGGGLNTRVYYANIGGFDTHANQPNQHSYLLGAVADAIAAFQRDLALQGRDKDVILMTFSEFGRRVKENASAGTDHGAASVMFVVGKGVQGGSYGGYPSLGDLDDGDLKFHTDFRSVYATVLDRWLGTPSNKVLGNQFTPLKFI